MKLKFTEMVKKLAEQYSKAPGERDEKAIGTILTDMGQEADRLEKDSDTGYAGTKQLSDQVAALKAQFDEQTERVRKLEKAGLGERNHRLETLGFDQIHSLRRVQKVFRQTDQAKAFGAWAIRYIFGGLPAYNDIIPAATRDYAAAMMKDMDPAVSAGGGALVADLFMADLIAHVEAVGVLFPLCDRVPLQTTGKTTWPKLTGELTARPVAAMAQVLGSSPTYTTVDMTPVKWGVRVDVPNEFFKNPTLLDALGQRLAWLITRAISYAMDNSLVNGDGTATYGGIMGLLNDTNISASTASSATTLAAYTAQEVGLVAGDITVDYVQEPRWLMSLSAFRSLRSIRGTAGSEPAVYTRGDNGDPNMIDDYPYTICQRFPTKAAAITGVKWGALGDLRLSHYWGMLGSIEVASSEHVKFDSDMTVIRGLAHFDSALKDGSAIVTAKCK